MVWTTILVLVLAAATAAAATVTPEVHIAATAAASLILASAAIWENRRLAGAGSSKNGLSAATSRHMGSAWAWAGLSLFAIYAFAVATWPEWWQFCLAFVALALICLIFALMTKRDEAAGREDWAMLTLARRLTMVQLVGMVVAMAGLIIDGKMTRFLHIRKGWEDWAANNIFFFGALALALISANALWTSRDMKKPDAPSIS